MKLKFKDFLNNEYELKDVRPDSTLYELKELLWIQSREEPGQQRLLYDGKLLYQEYLTVEDLGLKDGDTIRVLIRSIPPGPWFPNRSSHESGLSISHIQKEIEKVGPSTSWKLVYSTSNYNNLIFLYHTNNSDSLYQEGYFYFWIQISGEYPTKLHIRCLTPICHPCIAHSPVDTEGQIFDSISGGSLFEILCAIEYVLLHPTVPDVIFGHNVAPTWKSTEPEDAKKMTQFARNCTKLFALPINFIFESKVSKHLKNFVHTIEEIYDFYQKPKIDYFWKAVTKHCAPKKFSDSCFQLALVTRRIYGVFPVEILKILFFYLYQFEENGFFSKLLPNQLKNKFLPWKLCDEPFTVKGNYLNDF